MRMLSGEVVLDVRCLCLS